MFLTLTQVIRAQGKQNNRVEISHVDLRVVFFPEHIQLYCQSNGLYQYFHFWLILSGFILSCLKLQIKIWKSSMPQKSGWPVPPGDICTHKWAKSIGWEGRWCQRGTTCPTPSCGKEEDAVSHPPIHYILKWVRFSLLKLFIPRK